MKLTNTPQAKYRPVGCLKFNQYFLFIYLFSTAMLIFLITRCSGCLCTKFPPSRITCLIGPDSPWTLQVPWGIHANKISWFSLSLNLSPCPSLRHRFHLSEAPDEYTLFYVSMWKKKLCLILKCNLSVTTCYFCWFMLYIVSNYCKVVKVFHFWIYLDNGCDISLLP